MSSTQATSVPESASARAPEQPGKNSHPPARSAAYRWARPLRRAWNWLTSMRTALVLLFLLAAAAIPGALLPQRELNESKVIEYMNNNGKTAEIYDKLQLFDVFSSNWFTAIYVLLFISLIGCILPRSWEHWKALKTPPVRAPKRLERLPLHAAGELAGTPEEIEQQARELLKGWRISECSPEQDRAGKRSIAAERGYLREFFNLLFHLGLVAMLIAMAVGKLLFYEGHVIVVTPTGYGEQPVERNTEFCNTAPANYDSFSAGRLFDGTGLHPFCFQVHDFTADYLPNGQASMFSSNISYAEGDDILKDPSTWEKYKLRVNHPLLIAGDRVYLQGHGFAPTFTLTWPNGESRTQTVQFRPDDPTFFLSSGAVRFDPPAGLYPDLFERRQHQIALQGLFAPTAAWSGEKGELLSSGFPALRDPAVAIDIYRGDNGLDTGTGQDLYNLDPALMHSGQLEKIKRVNLMVGEEVTLDDGSVLRFDGAREYANYQISHDPTQWFLLASTVIMLAALVGSLAIRRRRVWFRLSEGSTPGTTHVQMAGLARTDHAGWGSEFDRMHRALFALPDPDDEQEEFHEF